jgi:hypothetical protein
VISKNGKELGTLRARETIQARNSFGGAVARYKNSGDNHRIEFYDGPDLIEAWTFAGDDGASFASRIIAWTVL